MKPKTERGISSDSPSIQLARALLESALKQEDEQQQEDIADPSNSFSSSSSSFSYHSSIGHNSISNDVEVVEGTKETVENGKEGKGKQVLHSRKTKSLDLSSISRPAPFQRASSSVSSPSTLSTSATPSKTEKHVLSSKPEQRSELISHYNNQDTIRPRSKSVSALSHQKTAPLPLPTIILSTITEDSEEKEQQQHPTALLSSSAAHPHQSKTSAKVQPSGNEREDDIRNAESMNMNKKKTTKWQTSSISTMMTTTTTMTEDTIGRSRADSLPVMPEIERERTLHQSSIIASGPRQEAIQLNHSASSKLPIADNEARSHGRSENNEEEEDDDWEVLLLRKRRKSSKYQPSSPSLLSTLLGSPSIAFTASRSSGNLSPHFTTEQSASHKTVEHPQSRRRTSSFRSIANQLARPLPRYRTASANDAIVSQNNIVVTQRVDMQDRVNNPSLGDIIRSSPSTNLDVWSEHLRTLLESTQLDDEKTPRHSETNQSADDSGFASLHDDSLFISPDKQQHRQNQQSTPSSHSRPTSSNASAMIMAGEGGLPRIPTLALISPMGTLRRHISCPDGILSSSPTKTSQQEPQQRYRRPLPCLPESENPVSVINIAHNDLGNGAGFSPVLPPLPPYQFPDIESSNEDGVEVGKKRKSVRRKSVVGNLRLETREQGNYTVPEKSKHAHTSSTASSNTPETIKSTSTNLDSFKTARSSLSSNLWPPPEELFASLFASTSSNVPSMTSPKNTSLSMRFATESKRVSFTPSTKNTVMFESSANIIGMSESTSYIYDPSVPDARKALQLIPRDLNTDLEVKPWWVVLPRFVLDDLAVGVRDWDKDRLEVYQMAQQTKSRQKSV